MTITVALAGNPNVGKSTIFNALTGSRQHVGNWPGKTVEKKEGILKINQEEILVVDLPGTYSLSAYSAEEIIARDFIVNENPGMVVAVVDAANLERNLYLVAQILELDVPLMLVLNMSDIAASNGLKIDAVALSEQLGGVPIIETVGNQKKGVDDLKQQIAKQAKNYNANPKKPVYTGMLKNEINQLSSEIAGLDKLTKRYSAHWLAVKLLEEDQAAEEIVQSIGYGDLNIKAAEARERVEAKVGEDAETLIADQRYGFVSSIIEKSLVRPKGKLLTRSDKIDSIITHRIWGVPIFLLMMWIVFQFTSSVSAPFLDWVEALVNDSIYNWVLSLTGLVGLGGTWIEAILTDGIIAGVGGVLVFVPVLLSLYFALAVLEDSGYMARAAFVMDRVMRSMGLHGKSFLPMIVGFGCTVPAIYATRTLENEKDRKLTGFLATFMSCGARLPVYVAFGAAFFGSASGNLIFAMYITGILIAFLTGWIMKRTIFKGEPPAPFVMELPPYRLPRLGDIWRQMWERTSGFVKKAGTLILGISVVVWMLMAIPVSSDAGSFNDVAPEDSIFGAVSGAIAPVFQPAGFGDWRASGSLITGILAKEVVIGTMNQIYVGEASEEIVEVEEPAESFGQQLLSIGVDFGKTTLVTVQEIINIVPRTINLIPGVNIGELVFFPEAEEEEDTTQLEAALVRSFEQSAGSASAGKAAAVAFNIFVLLYIPCMVAVAAMRQEFGSRWMWTQVGFTMVLAWVVSVLVFQIGRLIV